MGRARTGSIWRDGRDQRNVYARVTWTDSAGKRRDKKRKAMDEAHARSLLPALVRETREEKRRQPRRSKKYYRDNILIYCIQILNGTDCPIKIGTSSNIPKRIKMILTHQPHEVRLLGSWPGTVGDERAVHAMFASSHIAREWFRPTPELEAYIASKSHSEPSEPTTPFVPADCRGVNNSQAKLNDEKVRDIRARAIPGNYSQLAREHGVHPEAVRKIVQGRSWTHL